MSLPLQLAVYFVALALFVLLIRHMRPKHDPCVHCDGTGRRRYVGGPCLHCGGKGKLPRL